MRQAPGLYKSQEDRGEGMSTLAQRIVATAFSRKILRIAALAGAGAVA